MSRKRSDLSDDEADVFDIDEHGLEHRVSRSRARREKRARYDNAAASSSSSISPACPCSAGFLLVGAGVLVKEGDRECYDENIGDRLINMRLYSQITFLDAVDIAVAGQDGKFAGRALANVAEFWRWSDVHMAQIRCLCVGYLIPSMDDLHAQCVDAVGALLGTHQQTPHM